MSTTREYLDWLIRDAGLVELCQMDHGKLDVGWYDNADHLLHDARTMAGSGNLFTTINRIDLNAIKAHLEAERRVVLNKVCRTPDAAVTRYCRLFFDFDPERPTDTSSTIADLAGAEARAHGLARRLAAVGWPAPAVAMSGNGYHLQFRTALPNTPEVKAQLAAIYQGLHLEFSDDVVQFDRSVRNPARLCALYGSVKRKGSDTPERPHRKSWINLPADWRQVHPRQVAALADHFARQTAAAMPPTRDRRPADAPAVSGRGDYASLDVVRWFEAHGAHVGALSGIKHGVRCPWGAEHTSASPRSGSDTIVFESDGGWPGFHCSHSHCTGRTIRDVMALWGDAGAYCSGEFIREAAHA
ncbi:hypothetical protein [uncultured Thiodictyon sp.]|uniref:hypothetical protein n=1 Tax=uncultured Thiodictyon sp. TaxID=1846217 RepID=UPI0025CD0973|nr:hypothetical protein [uncultured Thiodictyon sp.]